MAEVEYPEDCNSNKSKEAKLIRDATPEPVPVVPVEQPKNAPVQEHRIASVKNIFHAIFPGGFQELKDHIIWDVFVPWTQDALHSGWDAAGDVIFPGSGVRRSSDRAPEHVSYEKQYRPSVTYDAYAQEGMRPVTRQEAENMLRTLDNMRVRYGVVRLLDFNELVGNPTSPMQQNYGWLSLATATVDRARNGGWIIKMPPAAPLN